MTRTEPVMVYFGRHKAASRYVTQVLAEVATHLGVGMVNASVPESRSRDWLIRTLPDDVRIMRASPYTSDIRRLLYHYDVPFRGFHLYRDPRDMIVSGYFSHRYSHPERWNFQEDHFNRIRELSEDEGIAAEIDYTGWLELDDMMIWDYADPHIMNVKFEDLIAEPERVYGQIFEFCGLALPDGLLGALLDQINFGSLSKGRTPGEEDKTDHYRKGVAGDWVNHMTKEHLEMFNRRYGALLPMLGYE